MKAERLLKNLLRRLGLQPGRRGTEPDGGGSSAAVVDVSRGTVSLQLTVWGQAL
ncbi:hypothetical protein [Paenarthrobacter nitroguajacolicus]|uniref:hypothetical protein n=1 Tax=Paenarthrobacter nitroguajacolicus TaxID=211146 RepID=UPI0015B977DC|nr:hypothetical protein [Paenarthrobacter nitroguajacolicus]